MGMSIERTISVACTIKEGKVAETRNRADLVPIVEFHRDRLVAVLHATGNEGDGTFPFRSLLAGARGFGASDVRLVWDGVTAQRTEEQVRELAPGDLSRQRHADPGSDVREALLFAVARRGELPCLHVRPYDYTPSFDSGGGLRVRWLEYDEDAVFLSGRGQVGAVLEQVWRQTALDDILAATLDDPDVGTGQDDLDMVTGGALTKAFGHDVQVFSR